MQIGLGIGATFRRKWVPPLTEQIRSLLFNAGQQGVLYDPSNLSTLFQDSAGTVPVTAMEQPVGRMLDLSGNGNHAFQATSTKRGVVSRRVNLLTKTEQFDDAAWVKSSGGVVLLVPNAATSPIGTGNATKLIAHTNSAIQAVYVNGINGAPAKTVKIFAKKAEYKYARIFNGGGDAVVFDLDSGAKVSQIGTNIVNASSDYVVDGWWLLYATITRSDSAYLGFGPGESASAYPFAGDGVSGIYIWGASLPLATDAHLPYQWVNTATDYDADPNKFPTYIRIDGVDDAYQTNSIDFTGTDKMTAWAGVTRITQAAAEIICELSTTVTNNSMFSLSLSSGNAVNFISRGVGGGYPNVFTPVSPAPVSAIVGAAGAINDQISTVRANGVSVNSNVAQGTGNYGNYPMYIGARAGTAIFFNGRLYQLIVRGAQSSLSQIEAGDLYIKRKMKLP